MHTDVALNIHVTFNNLYVLLRWELGVSVSRVACAHLQTQIRLTALLVDLLGPLLSFP